MSAGHIGGLVIPGGLRATPGVQPAPNSEPVGALSGVPPRTKLYQRSVTNRAQEVVLGTPENRLAVLTAPAVGWNIWVGDASVNTKTGLQLPPGLPYDVPIIGLQPLYAITDAPITLPLQIMVTIVLMAERQRIVG